MHMIIEYIYDFIKVKKKLINNRQLTRPRAKKEKRVVTDTNTHRDMHERDDSGTWII